MIREDENSLRLVHLEDTLVGSRVRVEGSGQSTPVHELGAIVKKVARNV